MSPISFTVRRSEPELVQPLLPTPRELKQLSHIDYQGGLWFQFPFLHIYKNCPEMDGQDPVTIIKEALAKALVHYYPLAGRIVEGPNEKFSVDCTGEGLLFIEASADISIDQLNDTVLSADTFLNEILYNPPGSDEIIGTPVILVQVTRLLCGGFILGVRFNHLMCDGNGIIQFTSAVAEIARGAETPSVLPVWQREILNARDPPRITCEHHEFKFPKDMNIDSDGDGKDIVLRRILISSDFINRTRKDLPEHLTKCTSYELITACLWKCVTIALNLDHDEQVYAAGVIDARNKIYKANIPLGYYGNAIFSPSATSKSKDLCEKPLAYGIELLKAAQNQMSTEYMRSAADLIALGGVPAVDKKSFFCISDLRFLNGHNYGWGFPVYQTPLMISKIPGLCFLTKYKDIKGRERVFAVINLPEEVMNRFEHELKKIMATTNDTISRL